MGHSNIHRLRSNNTELRDSLQEIQGLFEGEVQLHTDIVEVPSRAGLGNTLGSRMLALELRDRSERQTMRRREQTLVLNNSLRLIVEATSQRRKIIRPQYMKLN
uniref:Uncharacterized protein n=1 Tax=Opuntia streptacantha TaxID=393608 RepID=A0A7C9DN30_OPUST